jgi:hypothetical protein
MLPSEITRFVLVGIGIYFVVWAIFRLVTFFEYRRRLRRHQEEWQSTVGSGGGRVNPKWEFEHGSLRTKADLFREWRQSWSFVHAFQGAAAVAGTLLLAVIFLRSGGRDHQGTTQPADLSHVERRLDHIEALLRKRPEPVTDGAPASPSSPTVPALAFLVVCFAGGGALLYFFDSKVAQGTGTALILGGTLISGLKLLSVDKIFETKELFSFEWTPEYHSPDGANPPSNQASAVIEVQFGAFPDGGVEPDKMLHRRVASFAAKVASEPAVVAVRIVGRADRRELRRDVRKNFGTNWALAQQRADCVERVFRSNGVPPHMLVSMTAGPLYTRGFSTPAQMERDRETTAIVTVRGPTPAWLAKAARTYWVDDQGGRVDATDCAPRVPDPTVDRIGPASGSRPIPRHAYAFSLVFFWIGCGLRSLPRLT